MRKKRLRISSLFYFQPKMAEGSKSMTNEVKKTKMNSEKEECRSDEGSSSKARSSVLKC